MPGSIKSIKRKPTAKSAAKRIGRMFKRTNSENPELTAAMDTGSPKASLDAPRPSTSSRFSISSRMASRDDAEATPRGSKDQSRIFASWFDPATPKKEKGPEAMAPPPLVSAYSEPILDHVKPVEPMKPVESTKPPQTEGFPFPVPSQTSKEPKATDSIPSKQTEPLRQPENHAKKIQEQPASGPTTPQASRPLPSPPVSKPVVYEPESPILPASSREKPKQEPKPVPLDESQTIPKPALTHEHENLVQPKPAVEIKPEAERVKQRNAPLPKTEYAPKSPVQMPKSRTKSVEKSTVPRPTVEDEPELVKPAEGPEEQPRTKVKTEAKTEPRKKPRSMPSKLSQKETKPKAQPSVTAQKKDTTPIIPEAIHKHTELKASPKASTTPVIPPAPKTSSIPAPAPSSVPEAATYTAKHSFAPSILFQPSRTVYYPDTAPAPKIARAPITAPAPMIASGPEVVVSMLTRPAPKPAPVPRIASTPARAHSPSTSWIMSSA